MFNVLPKPCPCSMLRRYLIATSAESIFSSLGVLSRRVVPRDMSRKRPPSSWLERTLCMSGSTLCHEKWKLHVGAARASWLASAPWDGCVNTTRVVISVLSWSIKPKVCNSSGVCY